ncbi:MAG: hypothetical protein M4579_004467 [Chaenotheca gracillima]|nr:MAG: hypothetical protein M4579_004467 [Chaenotheca gracillima]
MYPSAGGNQRDAGLWGGQEINRSGVVPLILVFLIYWCAPAGNNKGSAWTEETEGITLENRHREAIYSSHRRFIVVSSDRQKCLCVPILTYGRRATTKRGINVQAHAVAHLSNAPAPALLRGEEVLSKGCIVIVPKDSLVRLHKTSRIDFSTVCTIEHNQKVKEVGGVADHSMEKLINLFNEQNLSSRE